MLSYGSFAFSSLSIINVYPTQIVWLLLKVGMVLFNIDFWHTKHLATILKDRYCKFCLKYLIKEKTN